MAVQQKIALQGALTLGPASAVSCAPFPSLDTVMSLGLEKFYGVSKAFARSISSPTVYEDLLAGLNISTVHVLAVRVQSGLLELRFTTPLASDQVMPVSEFQVWASPTPGSEITALSARGTASFEMIIAGSE